MAITHPDGTVSGVSLKLDRGWKGGGEIEVDMCSVLLGSSVKLIHSHLEPLMSLTSSTRLFNPISLPVYNIPICL